MNNQLPPIIEQYISNMNNSNQSIWTRHNYCQTLENIISICQKEVTTFKNEYNKLSSRK